MFYLRIRRKELGIRSYLCRLPSAVNVMLNLLNISKMGAVTLLFNAKSYPTARVKCMCKIVKKYLWSGIFQLGNFHCFTVDFTLLFRAALRSSLGSWVLGFEVANYVAN